MVCVVHVICVVSVWYVLCSEGGVCGICGVLRCVCGMCGIVRGVHVVCVVC